jgi:hypothetical protein
MLSKVQGGITLISKLLGGGGWGSVWCVVGVDLHSEGSAVRGRCTGTLFSSCSQQYRKELPSLNWHSGGGCSSVFYEALLIDFCATVTLFLQSNNISRILLQKKSLIFLPTCKIFKRKCWKVRCYHLSYMAGWNLPIHCCKPGKIVKFLIRHNTDCFLCTFSVPHNVWKFTKIIWLINWLVTFYKIFFSIIYFLCYCKWENAVQDTFLVRYMSLFRWNKFLFKSL